MDVHNRSVYGTLMEDNGNIIVQRNMENNIETVNGFLLNYKDHDIVIESSTSGKYLSKGLSHYYLSRCSTFLRLCLLYAVIPSIAATGIMIMRTGAIATRIYTAGIYT